MLFPHLTLWSTRYRGSSCIVSSWRLCRELSIPCSPSGSAGIPRPRLEVRWSSGGLTPAITRARWPTSMWTATPATGRLLWAASMWAVRPWAAPETAWPSWTLAPACWSGLWMRSWHRNRSSMLIWTRFKYLSGSHNQQSDWRSGAHSWHGRVFCWLQDDWWSARHWLYAQWDSVHPERAGLRAGDHPAGPDPVYLWLHGPGLSPTNGGMVDPWWRVHWQILHWVWHGQWKSWLRQSCVCCPVSFSHDARLCTNIFHFKLNMTS